MRKKSYEITGMGGNTASANYIRSIFQELLLFAFLPPFAVFSLLIKKKIMNTFEKGELTGLQPRSLDGLFH